MFKIVNKIDKMAYDAMNYWKDYFKNNYYNVYRHTMDSDMDLILDMILKIISFTMLWKKVNLMNIIKGKQNTS